jgi:hypothetical protein
VNALRSKAVGRKRPRTVEARDTRNLAEEIAASPLHERQQTYSNLCIRRRRTHAITSDYRISCTAPQAHDMLSQPQRPFSLQCVYHCRLKTECSGVVGRPKWRHAGNASLDYNLNLALYDVMMFSLLCCSATAIHNGPKSVVHSGSQAQSKSFDAMRDTCCPWAEISSKGDGSSPHHVQSKS